MQYPFGYGKTYTKFALESAGITDDKICVSVKNVGDTASETVLQLYVTCPTADFETPIKSLIGFKRISLKPQETVTFEFETDKNKLTAVDNDGNKVLLKGTYKFVVSDGCDFESEPIFYNV